MRIKIEKIDIEIRDGAKGYLAIISLAMILAAFVVVMAKIKWFNNTDLPFVAP